MSDLPFHQRQLEFMIDLARSRVEFLDPLFRFLNYFDTAYFYYALIPLIWIGFSYKWGIRVYYWFCLNGFVNVALKNAFAWPRPNVEMPELGLFHPTSFGFPSGGAQMAMFLGGLLIYYARTPLVKVIGVFYIVLISFSRLYIGVHYPLDVLGGWIAGVCLLSLFIFLNHIIEKWLIKQDPKHILLLSLAIPLVIWILFPITEPTAGSLVGVGLGIYFSFKHSLYLKNPKNLIEGFGRAFIGIALLVLIELLIPGKDAFYKAFLLGLFISLIASPLCKWLSITKNI
jgi:membrane-associated phospholipid phosphatase